MKNLISIRGGINRTVAILLVFIVLMLAILGKPMFKAFNYHNECVACEQAMKSAGDGLIIDYLGSYKEGDTKQTRKTIDEVMPARKNICPTGGLIYLIKNEHGIYQPVCGLHNSDKALRVRLNASYARNQLIETRRAFLEKTKAEGPEPESIEITVNSKPLICTHVRKEEMIHRGTATTNGYEGIVSFYGVAGDFDFSAKVAKKGNGTAKEGDVCYFVYADENYCAIWRSNDGWDGDAYKDQ